MRNPDSERAQVGRALYTFGPDWIRTVVDNIRIPFYIDLWFLKEPFFFFFLRDII